MRRARAARPVVSSQLRARLHAYTAPVSVVQPRRASPSLRNLPAGKTNYLIIYSPHYLALFNI